MKMHIICQIALTVLLGLSLSSASHRTHTWDYVERRGSSNEQREREGDEKHMNSIDQSKLLSSASLGSGRLKGTQSNTKARVKGQKQSKLIASPTSSPSSSSSNSKGSSLSLPISSQTSAKLPVLSPLSNHIPLMAQPTPYSMIREPRGSRQYDVPQIECPPAEDGMERFACPTPDRMGRYRCIDDHVLCDGFIDCPNAEDEDRMACMFYKTTKAHLDVLADALLRWARGRVR